MIRLQEVSKVYPAGQERRVTAVHDLNLSVEKGEFAVITGRSGSGKTTLLNLAAGLTRPTTGKVLLDGADLWSLSDQEQSRLRSRKFGFIFQFPSLLPTLNVLENVALPVIFLGDKKSADQAYERADELLKLV